MKKSLRLFILTSFVLILFSSFFHFHSDISELQNQDNCLICFYIGQISNSILFFNLVFLLVLFLVCFVYINIENISYIYFISKLQIRAPPLKLIG